MSEQTVNIVAKLYEMRRLSKFLLGDKYAGRMIELQSLILAKAAHDKTSEMMAVTALMREVSCDGHAMMQLGAAYVELIEPSGAAVA